jgi:chromosome segregation ATPase
MSDSSSDTSGPYTKSTIPPGDRKPPSTLSLHSTSFASPDKDALIDEYQSKMGDMLRCQQELCSIKTKLQVALDGAQQREREFLARETGYQQQLIAAKEQIGALETSAESHAKNEVVQTDQLTQLNDENQRYRTIIERQSRRLQEVESNIAKQREGMTVLQERHKSELNEVCEQVGPLKSERKRLKTENGHLQRQNAIAKQSIKRQQKDIEQLTETIRILEEKNAKLRTGKRKLKVELKSSSEESSVQQATITEQHSVIDSLRSQKDKYKDKCADLSRAEAELESQGQKVESLQAIVESKSEEIEDLERQLAAEQRKTKIASTIFSKMAPLVGNADTPKEILEQVGQLYQEMTRFRGQCNELKALEPVCERLKEERQALQEQIQQLKQRFIAYERKAGAGKAIERAWLSGIQELRTIGQQFGFQPPEIPLRSVIISVVLARRLAKIESGTVPDNRNWWWLSKNQWQPLKAHLCQASDQLASLRQEHTALSTQLAELTQQARDVEQRRRELDIKSTEYEQSMTFLREQIKELNEELSSLIDFETYEALRAESVDRKHKLKSALAHVKSLTAEKIELARKLEDAGIACRDQSQEIASLQDELEVAQARNEELSEDVQLLQKAQLVKTRELLSLERGIRKEQVASDRNSAQCRALAMENQQLFSRISPPTGERQRHSGDAVRLGLRATKTLL